MYVPSFSVIGLITCRVNRTLPIQRAVSHTIQIHSPSTEYNLAYPGSQDSFFGIP